MKTYTALIKATVNGSMRAVPTQVRALNATDARWLLQAIYGFHAVVSVPIEVTENIALAEITASKTPEQLRLDNLKAAKDRANDALKSERDRQSKQRAMKTLSSLNKPSAIKPATTRL